MSENSVAPWPQEEVDALNWLQKCGMVHPYTCGNCRDKLGTRFLKTDSGELIPEPSGYKSWEGNNADKVVILDRELIATKDGWVCLTCDWKQNWYYANAIETKDYFLKLAETSEFYKAILERNNER